MLTDVASLRLVRIQLYCGRRLQGNFGPFVHAIARIWPAAKRHHSLMLGQSLVLKILGPRAWNGISEHVRWF